MMEYFKCLSNLRRKGPRSVALVKNSFKHGDPCSDLCFFDRNSINLKKKPNILPCLLVCIALFGINLKGCG